ncbi:hypothetical protein [Mycolicibacterium mageritense]|uniref:hypothetical protein n=1 Tax=Mycolicibacterium mageritense TaxID=53462 RepID=UPI00103BD34F|nr:hypothetical protein [Mycolicibacterium mageritense]
MLELESGGGTLSVEGLHDRIEHTAPTTHTALNYLRAHKLVALRDGVLTDRTGDKMRGRKSALPTESLELAAIAAADAAVRKNIAALGDSTTRWFKHPDDDRWTPEALRDIRRETNAVYRVLPPGRRMTVDKFRYEVRKVTADHVDEVMARLEAAKFITVTDSTVTTHAALPVPEVPKTEKPETVTPAPAPIAVAAGGDVGDLASFSDPEVIETPKPESTRTVAKTEGKAVEKTEAAETPATVPVSGDIERRLSALEKTAETTVDGVRAIYTKTERIEHLVSDTTVDRSRISDAPEAVREVLVTIAAKLHRAAKEVKEGKRADPTLTNNEVKKSLSNRPLRGETVAPRDRFEEARQLGLRTGVIRTTHRSRLVFVSFEPLMESDDFGRRVANMGVRVAARTKGLVDAATNRVGVGK